MLYLQLLGPFSLRTQERAWSLRAPPKTLPLLAWLALRGQEGVDRELLAGVLWPDVPAGEARANLRRHLHYLRGALPPGEWFTARPSEVRWHAGQVEVDVHRFEALSRDPGTLEEATRLYRGPLLPGLDEEWLDFERERLRAQHLVNLGALVAHFRAALDHPRAIFHAERLLAEDPLREDTLRALLSLHAEAGNRTAALAAFERFRAHLDEELGVAPMPETLALLERLRRGEALGAFPLAAPGGPPRAGRDGWQLPLVGREAELEVLRETWRRVRGGSGQTVLLGGEAGVGKTRLARELALQAEAEGALVLVGRTTSPETRPHQAVAGALADALPLLLESPGAGAGLPVLAALLPALRARRPDLTPPPPLGAEGERERLAAAVAGAIAALARTRPVLFGLEDLHWASAASLELVGTLARRAPERTLILATSRDDCPPGHPLRALRRTLQEERTARCLPLARLGQGDALAAARAHLPESVAAVVAGRSDGLPLYLTELTFEARRGDGAGVPGSIAETVRGRLSRLPRGPRALVEVASVLGPAFTDEHLQELSGWPEGELFAAVDELFAARFLREAVGGQLAFVHGLVQDAVYAGLEEGQRRRLHRRAGRLLAQTPGRAAPGDVARHLERGGLGERAVPYLLAAAREAFGLGAPEEALAFVERGLTLTSRDDERFALVALREQVNRRRGTAQTWAADLATLRDLAAHLSDPEARCESLYRDVLYLRRVGLDEEEGRALGELRARAGDSELWRAHADLLSGQRHLAGGNLDRAEGCLAPALARFRALGRVPEVLVCLGEQAQAALRRGDMAAVDARLAEASGLGGGDPERLAEAARLAMLAAQDREDFGAQHGHASKLRELAVALFDRNLEATALSNLGGSEVTLGRYAEAREHLERAARLYAENGRRQGQLAAQMNLGLVDLYTGLPGSALEAFAGALAQARETHDLRFQGYCVVNAALAWLALGQPDRAADLARESHDLAVVHGNSRLAAWALGVLGQAQRVLGDPGAAHASLARAAELFRPTGRRFGLASVLCELVLLHLDRAEVEEAARAAEELRSLEPEGLHAELGLSVPWALARLALAQGRPGEAGRRLAAARARLWERAEALPDPGTRAAYLALPLPHAILQAAPAELWVPA